MMMMIWYASFIVPDGEGEFTEKRSQEKFEYTQSIALTAALFAVPSYGWLTDKLPTEH